LIHLTVTLTRSSADILRDYGANAKLHVQRDTTAAFLAPVDLPLIAILDGTESYETADSNGTASSWYRNRYEDNTAANASQWSTPEQPDQDTYATLDDVLRTFGNDEPSTAKQARYSDLLRVVTDELTAEIGRDFFRHPAVSGTETRYFTADSKRRLHVHEGIIPGSIVSVKYGTYGSTLTTVNAADYLTEIVDGAIVHLDLTGVGTTLQEWPTGDYEVEVVAAFGHATPPVRLREATVARVRQLVGADPSVQGGVPGPPELGGRGGTWASAGLIRWPDVTYRAIDHYRRRFAACYV
jgi:hypothetical protein